MLAGRNTRLFAAVALGAAVLGGCETAANTGGVSRDNISPRLILTTPNKVTPKVDSQVISSGLSFNVTASDNIAVDSVDLTFSIGFIAQRDTGFGGGPKSVTYVYSLTPAQLAGAGGQILIVGTARDGAGNRSKPDTITIFLSNKQALAAFLLAPTAGAVAGNGKYIPIQVKAVQQAGGIRRLGWTIGGTAGQTATTADSISTGSPPFPDSTVFTDSVLVTGTTGTFQVVGFAVDSAGRRAVSAAVTVTIQSVATDNTPPEVSQVVALRSEASDSITIHATDPSGITRVGFKVTDLLGNLIGGDSVNFAGTTTDQKVSMSLKLSAIASFPTQVIVQAFAIDGAVALNRGVTGAVFTVPSPNGASRSDTVTIVAGRTFALPAGGTIGDAIYNANTNEVYLTNTALSRLEIFQVANSTFVASGIPTSGPQPVGIALWPTDTLGNYQDSVIVANSGGTELSVLDVRPGVRALSWRQALPNFIIEKYQVLNVGGVYEVQITYYDVSDRPQYVAAICRPSGGTACGPTGVYALYSTTPTLSSSSPFSGRGTLRMERMTQNPASAFGHLFWEIGAQNSASSSDTLRVVEDRGLTSTVILSACPGVTIDFASFGLGDSTFVRNSGNFAHGFMGEGGNISASSARVMSYDSRQALNEGPGTFTTCNVSPAGASGPSDAGQNDTDLGMSPAFQVSDFISNTGIRITSIATNFNGLTNAVRADSIYFLDNNLRLAVTAPAPTGASGMDMNYNHTFSPFGSCPPCGGAGNQNDRVIFAAQPDGSVSVFDTFHGGQIGSLPLRDPIIGPLRVAKGPTGNQLLFGITARGLVMVNIPVITNPLPVKQAVRTAIRR
ncbi:MAG TPA: hypothetical protein VJN62_08830 [Gemmatimonadales bacterium]|nr:hypothetical protein [Gemmatimonadales bacterium]